MLLLLIAILNLCLTQFRARGQSLPTNLFNVTALMLNPNSQTFGTKLYATVNGNGIGSLIDWTGTPHAFIYYTASNQFAYLLSSGPSEVLVADGTNYAGYQNISNTVASLPSLAKCAIWNDTSAVLASSTFETFPQTFLPQGYTDAWLVGLDTNATPVGTAYVKINDAIPAGGDGSIIVVQEAQNAFWGNVDLGCGTGQTLSGVPFGCFTRARFARGGEQVGEQSGAALGAPLDSSPAANPFSRAVVWHGSAASMIDLHPVGYYTSSALTTDGSRQGGYATLFTGGSHAMIWSGTANSAVDLHPAEYFDTRVSGMCAQYQVGDGWVGGPANSTNATQHGLLWTGSAASVIDLNQFLPAGYVNFTVTGVDPQGHISGYARIPVGSPFNANTYIGIILNPNPSVGIASVALTPTSIMNGDAITGTVTLNSPAPVGGLLVNFSTDNGSLVPAPASVVVLEGQTSAAFSVTSKPSGFSTAPTDVNITAHLYFSSQSATVTVSSLPPLALQSMTINPTSVMSEYGFAVTVAINSPALAGGTPIVFTSSNPQLAPVPGGFVIAAGTTSNTYYSSVGPTNADTSATITASFNGTSLSSTLTISAANPITSFILTPNLVAPGDVVTAVATLAGPAPAGGQVVTFLSDNPTFVPVPATVLVPAGQSSITLSIKTKANPITGPIPVNLQAAAGNVPVSAQLTVAPIVRLIGLTAMSGLQGGPYMSATVILNYPPQSPLPVTVSCSNPAITNLPFVTVPAGQTNVTFIYGTMPVPVTITGTMTASAAGTTVSAPVVIAASPQPTIAAVTVPSVLSGHPFVGNISLSGAALLGGATIMLSSDNPSAVTLPASVYVPFGASLVTFTGTAAQVSAVTTPNITASFNGLTAPSVPLSIVPGITSFTLNPYSMIGPGIQTTGIVTLAQPAPTGGITVTISPATSQSEKYPSTLTVPAGQTTVMFTLQGNSVSSPVSTMLTAAFQGVVSPPIGATASTVLTVAPTDTLHITKCTWSQSTHLLTVTGTSSNPQSTINVLNANGNVPLGVMTNLGNGSYSFQTTIASIASVNIKSNLGGSTGQGISIVQ